MRRIDFWAGIPLCFLVTGTDRVLRTLGYKGRGQDRKPKRILFIQLAEMGTMVVAYPALRKTKELFPDAELHFLCFDQVRSSLDMLLETLRLEAVVESVSEQYGEELRALTEAEQDSKQLKSSKRHLLFDRIIEELQLPFPVGPATVEGEAPTVKDGLTKQFVKKAAESIYKQLVREKRGFVRCVFKPDKAREARIKEETKATVRVIPFSADGRTGKDVVTGEDGGVEVLFAQAY